MQRKYTPPTAKSDAPGMINLQIAVRSAHSLEDIWAAIVTPEKLARWMRPIAGKLAKGETMDVASNGKVVVTACEPKRRLAFSLTQGALTQGVAVTFGEEGKGRAKQRLLRLNISANRSGLPDSAWLAYGPASLGISWEFTCRALMAYLDDPASKVDFVNYARRPEATDYIRSAFAEWRAQAAPHEEMAAFMPIAQHHVISFYNGLHK
jgi:uncharacterized protein YndB with AHSA1/START domain